ncbi:MAG: hypothetical protein OXB86_03870, partial [Bdellovibrionales bacterium]|nr:hypothetical protein [Bdellovibrionales bacterium]
MMRFFLVFSFFLTLIGCDDSPKTATTGNLGTLKLSKSCTGGGTVRVYEKSSSASGGGTTTLQGSGLRSSIQGCPSSVNFKCTSPPFTAAAFGNNFTGNEVYICNAGKVTFSSISSQSPSYINTYP